MKGNIKGSSCPVQPSNRRTLRLPLMGRFAEPCPPAPPPATGDPASGGVAAPMSAWLVGYGVAAAEDAADVGAVCGGESSPLPPVIPRCMYMLPLGPPPPAPPPPPPADAAIA